MTISWLIGRSGMGLIRFPDNIREQMAEGEIANTLAANELRTQLRQLRAALEIAKIRLSDLRRRPQETVNYAYKGEWRTVTLTREIIEQEMDQAIIRGKGERTNRVSSQRGEEQATRKRCADITLTKIE